MQLLILATATNQRLQEVIEEALSNEFEVALLVQHKRLEFFAQYRDLLKLIPTNTDFIEYKAVLEEGIICKNGYDEIWIPSAFDNNINSFGEAITLALDLKPRKVVWKAPGEKNIEINRPTIKKKIESELLWISYQYGKWKTRIQSKVMGYKW